MYAEDTFFHLSVPGRIGLVLVSVGMGAGLIWLSARLSRSHPWWQRACSGFLLLWLFLWLSPQVYYAYFLFVIDGLPWQIVIGWPPPPGAPVQLLMFAGPPTLAAHGAGALGWACILAAALPRPLRRNAAN